jgi:hypothetical protein
VQQTELRHFDQALARVTAVPPPCSTSDKERELQMENGKIAEEISLDDGITALIQLDLIPPTSSEIEAAP